MLDELTDNNVSYLHDLLLEEDVKDILTLLEIKGVLRKVLPDFDKVFEMQGSRSFKGVWPHTKIVVAQSKPTRVIRWSALFHDFGKAHTFSNKDGKVSFHGHEAISSKLFVRFAKTWKIFSKEEFEKIKFLIFNLGYVEAYSSEWTESAVRRFGRDMGEHVDDLLELSRADITTKFPEKRKKILNQIDELGRRVKEVQEKDSKISPLPKGIGHTIIEISGLEPGEEIAEIKRNLISLIENGEVEPFQDKEYYIPKIKEILEAQKR